jgi:hypothetical protein
MNVCKIEARIRANDSDGIGLEIMACLIMIAEFLRRAYDDTEELWKNLFGASGLKIIDTITGGESTTLFQPREGDHGPAAAAGGLARKQRRIGEELCHGLADRARVARAQLVLMRHQEVDLSRITGTARSPCFFRRRCSTTRSTFVMSHCHTRCCALQ